MLVLPASWVGQAPNVLGTSLRAAAGSIGAIPAKKRRKCVAEGRGEIRIVAPSHFPQASQALEAARTYLSPQIY